MMAWFDEKNLTAAAAAAQEVSIVYHFSLN